jgi:hypothetical protein
MSKGTVKYIKDRVSDFRAEILSVFFVAILENR